MKAIAHANVKSSDINYRQEISTAGRTLVADEPASAGGQDAGPAPYDYLLASLGTCTAITLRMYAEHKGWKLDDLRVELSLWKNREGETRIDRVLHCSTELDESQWQRLLDIAGKTPVTKTLLTGVAINTSY
jgi:putative redox protein